MGKTVGKAGARGLNWRKGKLKYTADGLDAACNDYFAACERDGRKVTRPGLVLHLGIAEETFRAWLANDGAKYTGVSGALKRAMLRMQDDLEQRGDAMSLFRLKQPCYGGYSDRPAEDNGLGVKVSVAFGAGEGKVAVEYGK